MTPRPFLAFALLLATAGAVRAEALFAPLARPRAGIQRLHLAPGVLAALRARGGGRIAAVPLGTDRVADLELRRVDVFAPGARIEVMDPEGPRTRAAPNDVYLGGSVAGEPDSFAILALAPASVRGVVRAHGHVYRIGPDPSGAHTSRRLPDPPADAPPALCGTALDEPGAPPAIAPQDLLTPIPDSTMLKIDLALETDHEFWDHFGAEGPAIAYLAELVAGANTALEPDLAMHVRVSFLRLWPTAADPWTPDTSAAELRALRTYWIDPANGMDALADPYDAVVRVSGRPFDQSIAGRAYLNGLCNTFGFALVRTAGRAAPDIVQTFTHELGHILGSPHTHCYDPPIDLCFNRESGCYAGPLVPSVGTVMSYCHSYGDGRLLAFHQTVRAYVRPRAAAASCVTPLCGDADPDVCDDGHRCTDDVCDAAAGCQHLAVPGCCETAADCDDGNPCTTDACNGDTCAHATAPDGTSCSDGDPCHDGEETCAAGACTPGTAPTGYAGIECTLRALGTTVGTAGHDELAPKMRRRLFRRLARLDRKFDAAGRAHRAGRFGREATLLRAFDRRLARLARVIAAAERRRRPRIAPELAARLQATLGTARRQTSGVRSSISPEAIVDRAGIVRFLHRARHSADLPPAAAVLAALDALDTPR